MSETPPMDTNLKMDESQGSNSGLTLILTQWSKSQCLSNRNNNTSFGARYNRRATWKNIFLLIILMNPTSQPVNAPFYPPWAGSYIAVFKNCKNLNSSLVPVKEQPTGEVLQCAHLIKRKAYVSVSKWDYGSLHLATRMYVSHVVRTGIHFQKWGISTQSLIPVYLLIKIFPV